jgi:hypothetical protein
LAPKFSGPFKILRVKNQHNVELLLANGRKIVVNVARIKPYFSSATTSASDENILHSGTLKDNANGFLTTQAFSDSTKTFDLPTLMPSQTHKPGRPLNLAADSKVLSPTPAISFSKQGRDLHPGGVPPERNETEVTLAHAHPMHTRTQKEEISAIMQDVLLSTLNSVIECCYHCIIRNLCKKKPPVSPSQPHPSGPRVGLSVGDLYKYSSYPETGISEQQPLNLHPFNHIIGDNYFDDSVNDSNQDNVNPTDEHQDFDFDDILPFLEEDDDYDLDGAFCHYEADAGFQVEGEVHSLVQLPVDQVHDPALL